MKTVGGITIIQGLTQSLGILSQRGVPLAVSRIRAGFQGREVSGMPESQQLHWQVPETCTAERGRSHS